jgi:hypothetical protein
MQAPQNTLAILDQHHERDLREHTKTHIIMGMKMEGRSLFKRMLVKGSKTAYDTKKMVRVALYAPVLSPSSFWRPAILALPMLVLSRKANK